MPNSILTIVLVSVIGGLLYAAYEQHVKLQLKKHKAKPDEETQKEIADLKERVAVLEKIVTDEKYNLRKEIDSLDKAS
ncbi:MAG: hypothetical protein HWE10_03985 [Gammaproteobacteria bacterium]|nr:hypothetical protein [Gammaproteobacteria bacterium]